MDTVRKPKEASGGIAPEIAISGISSLILGAIAFVMWANWDLLAPIAR